MHKFLLTILTVSIALVSFSQTAEDLVQQSKGFVSKGDIKNAVILTKQAAELGNAEAQFNLGHAYEMGIEVEQNDSLASVWYLKSAMQGLKDGQLKIAYRYDVGHGMEQNSWKAFYWYLKCARQNDVQCMISIIDCYSIGHGTFRNADSILAWAVRLATLEVPENKLFCNEITSARLFLADCFRQGEDIREGIQKDFRKSYTWYLIYNENKKCSLVDKRKEAEAMREVENNLTAADKVKAKEDAEKVLNRKLTESDDLYSED